ncbi:MAG: hypothetical protein WEE69_02265 [Acidimicrobiia bacterium]
MRAVMRLAGSLFVAVLAAAAFGAPASASVSADSVPISGEVDGLYPGGTVTLVAKVTNPFPFAIRVTSVDATPAEAGACPASMLNVTRSSRDVVVEPGATAGVPLQVHLDRNAGDACQGATFTVAFTGTIVEAVAGSSTLPTTGGSIEGPLLAGSALVALGLALRRRARQAAR